MSQQQQQHQQQELGSPWGIQQAVEVLPGSGLFQENLSPVCSDQELDPEIPAMDTTSSLSSTDHHVNLFQYVEALLAEGLFEKALSLSCDCYRDPELGKESLFLETAFILFTNMEKLDLMWTEVKTLDSMGQLYPAAKSLSQYYIPAALLTAEMLLCKEWCEKTISLSDLQKVTTLWVTLLWAQCSHDNEAFQTKVLQVGKLIVHEPTFVLNLVNCVHAEIGRQSLVICLNLCLMALQEPVKDPQSNLVNASSIDTNNAALCQFLSDILTEDTSLRRLCLLTAFTITPTKELLVELDRLYKPAPVQVLDVPLMPSCLNCVLRHGMYSLLPDIISPLVDWRELRGKCLRYLRESSVLNVRVKLPNREMTLKVYVKKFKLDGSEDADEGMELRRFVTKTNDKEGSLEEPHQSLPRLRTELEQRWLSNMMSLDLSWRPHWVTTSDAGSHQGAPGLKESPIQSQRSHNSSVSSDAAPSEQEEIRQCKVVLCNFKDTLFGHFHVLENRANSDQSPELTQEESLDAMVTVLQEDHAYSLPPPNLDKQTSDEELCISQQMNATDVQSPKQPLITFEESSGKDNNVTESLNSIQLTTGMPVEESSQNSDRSSLKAGPHSSNQECLNPTIERCLDSLATELSYLEDQNILEKSPESEDRLTEEDTSLRVHPNFLADLKDDMIDPELPVLSQAMNGSISTEEEPSSDLTPHINRWFQNIQQPSETSSIVGSDVTPDPLTEEGMQWSAIKAISNEGNQTLYELGWNQLGLWFSEEEDVDRTAAPKPAVSSSITATGLPILRDPYSLELGNDEADPIKGICSLESTINRLRANLGAQDSGPYKNHLEDWSEVTSSNPPTSSLQTSPEKPSKQRHAQLNAFSQQPYHQQSVEGYPPKLNQTQIREQSIKQQMLNQQSLVTGVTTPKTPTKSPKSADSKSTDNATLPKLFFSRQTSANWLSVGNSTTQQDSNQPLNYPPPMMKYAISQGLSNEPPASKQEEKVKVEVNCHVVNIKQSNSVCGAETLPLDKASSESLQKAGLNTTTVLCCNPVEDKKSRNPQSVDTCDQHNKVQQDFFAGESPSRSGDSPDSCIITLSPNIKQDQIVDQTCEGKLSLEDENKTALDLQQDVTSSESAAESSCVNSSLVCKTNRTNYESEATPFQNESKNRLLDSLLFFAVQEYRQITGSPADDETTRKADTVEIESESNLIEEDPKLPQQLSSQTSKNDDAAIVSENKDITPEVMHSATQSAPADSLSEVELSQEHNKPEQLTASQSGRLAVSNEEPSPTEASELSNTNHVDIPDSSDSVTHPAQKNPQLLEWVSPSNIDKIKEFQSDSDCSDFEVVQDVSSRWLVGGKRKTSEPYSWPQKKERGQHQEMRSSEEKSKTQSLQMSENKPDFASKETTVNCPTPPLKEEIHHLPEPESSSVADQTQAPKLAANEKRKNSTTSQKSKPTSGEKAKEKALPPSHRYNLRAADRSINYFVVSSSTNFSSETSGEKKGTGMGYSLRSSTAHVTNAKSTINRTLKKPPRAFKSVQTKAQANKSQPSSHCSCPKALGKKAGGLAKLGTVLRSQKAPSKRNADLNNNCSSISKADRAVTRHGDSSINSVLTNKKPPLTSRAQITSSKLTAGVRGKLTVFKNPQLPWESKPPIRTYSSKRKLSSSF